MNSGAVERHAGLKTPLYALESTLTVNLDNTDLLLLNLLVPSTWQHCPAHACICISPFNRIEKTVHVNLIFSNTSGELGNLIEPQGRDNGAIDGQNEPRIVCLTFIRMTCAVQLAFCECETFYDPIGLE